MDDLDDEANPGGTSTTVLASKPEFDPEREIAALRSKIRSVEHSLVFVMVFGLFLIVGIICCMPSPAPDPVKSTNRDYTLRDLLKPETHCFDSPDAMQATRNRVIAAIERAKWENHFEAEQREAKEREDPYSNHSWSPPAVHPEGTQTVSMLLPRDADEARCFAVTAPQSGYPYLDAEN